jgi:predicted ATPase
VGVDQGLAGRLAERNQVGQVLASQPRSAVLLVLGEAGIGKSRLVAAATSDARLGGVHVLAVACLPTGAGMPLLPFGEIIRSAHQVDGASG